MGQVSNQGIENLSERKKILIIDYEVATDELNRSLYEDLLKDYCEIQCEIILAQDLEKGLEKIWIELPDLIISEICLSSKYHPSYLFLKSRLGFQVIEELEKLKLNIPIIFNSTIAKLSNNRALALQKGAYACFNKPDNLDEFRQTVRRALGLEESQKT